VRGCAGLSRLLPGDHCRVSSGQGRRGRVGKERSACACHMPRDVWVWHREKVGGGRRWVGAKDDTKRSSYLEPEGTYAKHQVPTTCAVSTPHTHTHTRNLDRRSDGRIRCLYCSLSLAPPLSCRRLVFNHHTTAEKASRFWHGLPTTPSAPHLHTCRDTHGGGG
jgi:hypothetical protein